MVTKALFHCRSGAVAGWHRSCIPEPRTLSSIEYGVLMILIEQVSASLTANDPELTDMIGVIASRLIENIPDEETGAEVRKDALLERADVCSAGGTADRDPERAD